MSDHSDYEEGEFGDEAFEIPAVELAKPQDILGQDLKFLGYTMSISGDLLVVETLKSSTFGPGSLVLIDDYTPFGHVVDIFGPILKPLYIVKPVDSSISIATGTPLYVCERLCKTEDPDQSDEPEEGEERSIESEDDFKDYEDDVEE